MGALAARIQVVIDATLSGSTATLTIREDSTGNGSYDRSETFDLVNGRVRYGAGELSQSLISNDVQLQIEIDSAGDVTNSVEINDIEVEY